jgi:MFS family permease
MLGEGIAISSLPLHMQSLGASDVLVGAATSAFSVAQMFVCPVLVKASGRLGRLRVQRYCLAGAALANLIIAASTTSSGIIAGRFLAGAFAASVPVAQAASADVVTQEQTGLALSRVSAASHLGVVVGPAVVAVLASLYMQGGMAPGLATRAVFASTSLFALVVLGLSAYSAGTSEAATNRAKDDARKTKEITVAYRAEVPCVQPMLRIIALAFGWSLTLSVSTYCLLGSTFMGYGQPQLSATFSAGAALTILTQLFIFPRLVRRLGEHKTCAMGLFSMATGLAGCSLVHLQPAHTALYVLNRFGSGVGDTSTATIVASVSRTSEARDRNLGLIQSTRAAARIITPVLSGKLFEVSCFGNMGPVGALPYLILALLSC